MRELIKRIGLIPAFYYAYSALSVGVAAGANYLPVSSEVKIVSFVPVVFVVIAILGLETRTDLDSKS